MPSILCIVAGSSSSMNRIAEVSFLFPGTLFVSGYFIRRKVNLFRVI